MTHLQRHNVCRKIRFENGFDDVRRVWHPQTPQSLTRALKLPELRKDPIVHRWVVMAPERAKRPIELVDAPCIFESQADPFAEGNEKETPPEILAYREEGSDANGPGWRVRVVPNKFPALEINGNLNPRGDDIYEMMNGFGAHEVIIECPQSESNMSRLSVENIREVFCAYRERLIDLKRDPRLVHATIFKNKGALAGASVNHSHSQLIATPVVPITIWEEINGSLEFYNNRGLCIFEEMIRQEITTGTRVVLDTPNYLAFCPYASRFPFETWILPKQPGSHFENIQKQDVDELGQVMKTVLQKLERALDDPPYNYVIHTAPFNQPELPHFSWHIELFPRLTRVAGFEWGSGIFINPVMPEVAAKLLREVDCCELP